MAKRTDSVPRLITRSDIASYFGVDRRRNYLRNLRPIAYVEIGGKQIDLFEGSIIPAVSVNAGEHPVKQGVPQLTKN